MFSILRSEGTGHATRGQPWEKVFESLRGLASMDDRIPVAVIQRAGDLPGKLSCRPLPQPSMTDDIVQHLPSVDEFEHHVIVVRVHDHLPHPADVRVMQQERDRGFPDRPRLFRCIAHGCRFLLFKPRGQRFPVRWCRLRCRGCRISGNDLDRALRSHIQLCLALTLNLDLAKYDTHLFPRIHIGRRLDLAHAARPDRLAQLPIPDLSSVLDPNIGIAPGPRPRWSTVAWVEVVPSHPIYGSICRWGYIRVWMTRCMPVRRRWSRGRGR